MDGDFGGDAAAEGFDFCIFVAYALAEALNLDAEKHVTQKELGRDLGISVVGVEVLSGSLEGTGAMEWG